MPRSNRRFGFVFTTSLVVTLGLVYLVASVGLVMGLLPVVGIGGIYAEGESFEGNVGKIYPAYQTGGDGSPGNPITDAPAEGCDVIPMTVFSLQDAKVTGATFRKDLRLPFLTNRHMSLIVNQPAGAGGEPAFFDAQEVRIYITQLKANQLIIRNIMLREAGPGGNYGSAGDPRWGPNSGELYVEGGQTEGTVLPDGSDGDVAAGLKAQNLEMWIHGIEGELIGFRSGDQSVAVDISLEFPTDGELDQYYDGRLGFDLPEYPNEENPTVHGAEETSREEYFSCTPVGT